MEEIDVDGVFIAGSGPIACTFARIILDGNQNTEVFMAEIGSHDNPVVGGHFKNTVKYQKDIDAFAHVIKGALQSFSMPPEETHQETLGGNAWRPEDEPGKVLIYQGRNPNQDATLNLRFSAITRTVGGMSTHWTCNCPAPEETEERQIGQQFVPFHEFDTLFAEAGMLLNVHPDQYDDSIRHTVVKEALEQSLPEGRRSTLANLDLGVERRADNPDYVTWTSASTILGPYHKIGDHERFKLHTEMRVTRLIPAAGNPISVGGVIVHDLNTGRDILVKAKGYVIACGAVCTPQILWNSKIEAADLVVAVWNPAIHPPALGCYLSEQSVAFCQIVLSRDIVNAIPNDPRFMERVQEHQAKHPQDPIPIPFNDPEPQLSLRYSPNYPWHVQIHRDAFSYGDLGPRADSRIVVDLRWFGRSEINSDNRVEFGPVHASHTTGVTDIYGMPQPTFFVRRSKDDGERDQRMMKEMCEVANMLGGYVPGSYPTFMEPGLALHITGTTRIGGDQDLETSVVNSESRVHGIDNLWLGGCNVIPDSTACNPTRTAVSYAIKGARAILTIL